MACLNPISARALTRDDGNRWVVGVVAFAVVSLAFAVPTQAQPVGTAEPVMISAVTTAPPDNPLLQVSEDHLNLIPVTPPPPREGPATANPGDMVMYDPVTRTETVYPATRGREFIGDYAGAEGFHGLLPAPPTDPAPESVIGTDGRTQRTDTTSFPWRSIVRLAIKYPGSTSTFGCTGAMVDNFHVLTAGHCVHDVSNGGYADSITVYPGQNGTALPYNQAIAILDEFKIYTSWTRDQNRGYDMALLTLDRNVGMFLGWMGRATHDTDSSVYRGTLNVSGYPCDKPSGTQWWHANSASGLFGSDLRLAYTMDTFGCQSGAPVWQYISASSSRNIVAVHAYGAGGGTTNSGTRLTSGKLTDIDNWRADDTAPTDKPDLVDEGNSFAGFSPTNTGPGDPISLYSDVRNIGTKEAGDFYVSYYASTNNFISPSDHYLGRAWVSSLGAFTKANANVTGQVPANMPAGSYFIGWLIDSSNTQAEFSENNNKGLETSKLTVVLQKAAVTSSAASSVGQYSATLNALVNPNGTTTNVYFQYGLSAAYGTTVNDGSAGSGNVSVPRSYSVSSLLCGRTYYYRAYATSNAGTTYGGSRTFNTAACPAPGVITDPAVSVKISSAVLNGRVTPNGASTTAWFELGTTTSYGTTIAAGGLGSGMLYLAYSRSALNLDCNQQYHFRAAASNSSGTRYGRDHSFTTAACTPPAVTTLPPSNINQQSATLRADVKAFETDTSVYFDIGTTQALGHTINAGVLNAGGGTIIEAVAGGLTCGETYFYRGRASNKGGTTNGSIEKFATQACPQEPPGVTTQAASAVGAEGATFNGAIDPKGDTTHVYFDWGLSAALGNTVFVGSITPTGVVVNMPQSVGSLSCETEYFFQLWAANSGGTTYGNKLSFFTASCPVATDICPGPSCPSWSSGWRLEILKRRQ
jgi:V8-like Glu-specific endopeptidase